MGGDGSIVAFDTRRLLCIAACPITTWRPPFVLHEDHRPETSGADLFCPLRPVLLLSAREFWLAAPADVA
jgi:hypothetical protein